MSFALRNVAALVALLGAGSTPTPGQGIPGTYEVAGTAHVSVSPFPAHDYPGELTATFTRTRVPETLSLRLEAQGYGCTLEVRVGRDGSLQFPDRATCPLDVSQPDARGHVDAQLRAARARVVNNRLEMDLQFDVNGSIQLRIPSRTVHVFGADLQTPAMWAPSAPVHGTVAASGNGSRQASLGR